MTRPRSHWFLAGSIALALLAVGIGVDGLWRSPTGSPSSTPVRSSFAAPTPHHLPEAVIVVQTVAIVVPVIVEETVLVRETVFVVASATVDALGMTVTALALTPRPTGTATPRPTPTATPSPIWMTGSTAGRPEVE